VRKKLLPVLAIFVAIMFLGQPYDSRAETEVQKIEKEIRKIQQQMNKAAQEKKQAEQNVRQLSAQKAATKEDIARLMNEIAKAGEELVATQAKIDAAEERLMRTTKELEAAEEQRESRDELLQKRIRMIYMNGAVSYLDVLLSSTSFDDFLTRFNAMKLIMQQDKSVLEQSKQYEAFVAEKKAQVEAELGEVRNLYAEMATRKANLELKERQKEVLIAQLNEKIEETEEISEEAEKALMEFGQKYSELLEKKKKIRNYYTGGKLGLPLKREYRLSSPFGYRIHPVTGKRKLHTGIDMAVPEGTPVYAAESGVVIVAQTWSGYGNTIVINHGNGLWTLYGHLKPGGILVEKGQTVKRGEKIGLVGKTGTATGYHLHFEVRKNGNPVDPTPYLK